MLRPKIFFILLFTGIIFVACDKYEDGPWMSLRSAKNRIEGGYSVESFVKNGTDLTAYWVENYNWVISFRNDPLNDEHNFFARGKYIIDTTFYNNYYQFGNYEWNIGKTQVIYNLEANEADYGFYPFVQKEWIVATITRLTNKELWLTKELDNDFYEIHLTKIEE